MNTTRRLSGTDVAVLLSLHRAGASTRTKLARALGLGSATVFRASEALLDEGWIIETQGTASSAGRRARPIAMSPRAGHVLAVNLSAERADMAAVAADLTISATTSIEVDLHRQGPEPVFDRIADAAKSLFRRIDSGSSEPRGLGIAIAGLVEAAPGTPVMPSGLPLWQGYRLGSLAQEYWSVPVVIDNDANLCALGEMFRGAGRDSRNFVYVHLDIGIGAGLVIERQLYRGTSGFAGEIGHIRVPGVTRQCPCGKIGCLQAVAAEPALLSTARGRIKPEVRPSRNAAARPSQLTLADVASAAAAGNPAAIELVTETGLRVGQVLATVCSVVSPDRLLLGGRLMVLGQRFVSSIRRALTEDVLPGTGHHVSVELAELGAHAGLMGAAAVALERVIVESAATATPSAAEKLANHPIASLVI